MTDDASSLVSARGSAPMGPREMLQEATGSDFLRNIIATLGNRLLLIAIGLVTSVLVTRALGPEGRGQFAVAVALGAVGVQLGNLGLHASNTWAVSRDPRLLAPLLANSLAVSLVVGGGGAILIWAIVTVAPGVSPLPPLVLAIGLLAIPIGLAYLLLQNLLLGTNRIRAFNLLDLAGRILTVVCFAALILADWVTVASALIVVVGVSILATIAAGTLLVQRVQDPIRPSLSLLREHSSYGAKAYFAALFAFLTLRLDLLMVQYIRGSADAGYYSIAVTLADLVYLLPVVVGTLLFPRLSAITDSERQWRIAWTVAVALGVVMTAVAIVAGVLGGTVISILYGEVFLPAVPAFVVLLPGIVGLSMHVILMNYAGAVGMPPITVYAPLAGFIVNVALNLWLIPTVGIVGASVASTIAYSLMLAISATYFLQRRRSPGARTSTR